LEGQGFKFNPYDPCVANWVVKSAQHIVVFHVDDLKFSHKDPKVNDDFAKWLEQTYWKQGKVKINKGKVHTCAMHVKKTYSAYTLLSLPSGADEINSP